MSVLTAAGLGLAFGVAGTASARWLAWRLGWLSEPNPLIAQHRRPVAYLGGLGLAIATILALALASRSALASEMHVLGPALLFLALGLVDDVRPISAASKLGLQAVAAAIAVGAGVTGNFLGNPLVDGALSLLWIVVLVNAFNVIDVCDGLLAGIAVVFFAFTTIAAPAHAMLAACLVGACLGFLAFNRPRASIFLGDGGSLFLGFLAAAISLTPGPDRGGPRYAIAVVLALALPLFEAFFLAFVRTARGLPWWRGSRDHFALRLQSVGFSTWGTDLVAWTSAGLLTTLALALPALPSSQLVPACAFVLIAACGAALWLAFHTEPRLPAWSGSRTRAKP
jgi:UDP-GlcNAc:undecaprenyl-phosphate GlcNAc-1-phosphate transferase